MSAARLVLAGLLALAPVAQGADDRPAPIEVTTPSGDRVLLHSNGRWEYLDRKKAEEAKKLADSYPENQTRPIEAQGGWLGFGRTLMPGDRDYNRGSLNPKQR